MTHEKTYNKSPRRINHKATKSKTNTGTTALERSVEKITGICCLVTKCFRDIFEKIVTFYFFFRVEQIGMLCSSTANRVAIFDGSHIHVQCNLVL